MREHPKTRKKPLQLESSEGQGCGVFGYRMEGQELRKTYMNYVTQSFVGHSGALGFYANIQTMEEDSVIRLKLENDVSGF